MGKPRSFMDGTNTHLVRGYCSIHVYRKKRKQTDRNGDIGKFYVALFSQNFWGKNSSLCDGIASLGNMLISNSRLGESSKYWVYSAVNHPWWMSMLFHRRGLLWLCSAVRYIWLQRWDNDNCWTGVALPM